MKNKVIIKRIVLLTSFVLAVSIFVFDNATSLGFCSVGDFDCRASMVTVGEILLFSPLILFFSLITYKMSESVFVAWWAFSKYAIPIIFPLSLIINSGLHHNPAGQWQDMFDATILSALYGIFFLGSLIQIVRGYFRSKSPNR